MDSCTLFARRLGVNEDYFFDPFDPEVDAYPPHHVTQRFTMPLQVAVGRAV